MKASFIVNVPIKDKAGRIVGHKQVVRYEGLLAKAHEDGLRSIATHLVQAPSKANNEVGIVRAVVVTGRGSFEGLGDASPSNVNARVTGHLLRVAETRAKARALRDAVNIGIVALEELEDVDDLDSVEPMTTRSERTAQRSVPTTSVASPSSEPPGTPANANAPAPQPEMREDLMTPAQRRLLFRIAAERGVATENIQRWLEEHLGLKPLKTIGKYEASRLIERLKANGHAEAAP